MCPGPGSENQARSSEQREEGLGKEGQSSTARKFYPESGSTGLSYW